MANRDLVALNDRLFNELDKLDAIDMNDTEAVQREIERAKAIQGIASTIITNARTCIDAVRVGTDVGESVSIPKGLIGGSNA